jgi:hypothetical protein
VLVNTAAFVLPLLPLSLPQVRLHGTPLMDEAAFIEGLSRAAIFMLSRAPLDSLYPADGDRVDAVFRR